VFYIGEKMKKLIIVGAGGFGREVLGYARDVQAKLMEWEIKGFVDDNPNALENVTCDIPIIGAIRDYQPQEEDFFVMAIGSPKQKLDVAQKLTKNGAKFISLIHPTARSNGTLGCGCVLSPFSFISCNVQIGDFVTINVYASIGHDSVIGDGCTLISYASVGGSATLGKGIFVGAHGCILNNAKIGDFATVAAGSVVIKSVKPGTTVIGVPAKKLLSTSLPDN
jgi:sugar O-acyltransferase (sialic acid O-acetyltransferase NeuD family)